MNLLLVIATSSLGCVAAVCLKSDMDGRNLQLLDQEASVTSYTASGENVAKRFACSSRTKAFKNKDYMKQHMKAVHGAEALLSLRYPTKPLGKEAHSSPQRLNLHVKQAHEQMDRQGDKHEEFRGASATSHTDRGANADRESIAEALLSLRYPTKPLGKEAHSSPQSLKPHVKTTYGAKGSFNFI